MKLRRFIFCSKKSSKDRKMEDRKYLLRFVADAASRGAKLVLHDEHCFHDPNFIFQSYIFPSFSNQLNIVKPCHADTKRLSFRGIFLITVLV